jgi:thiol-disulfide isomerase/thioredoxin
MRFFFPSLLFILSCLLAVPLVAQDQQEAPERYKIFETYDDLANYLEKYSDQTLVVNYWATYCGPCVKEVPLFNEIQEKYKNRDLKVVMVNLDFKSQLKARLDPFLLKHSFNLDIGVLVDQDADTWIPRAHPDWDGELPFTLIYQKGVIKDTHRQDFPTIVELEKFVLPYLPTKPVQLGK